ncbi:MAG: poly-gamma-glutamate synthase PgsB [Deltaproteobacteria bacterium]|jgi:poly-gamma-glutamate synthase PgsB/CapB|nr:poly-gamma-glutamate synthase PgsB [Deltaproteobacteria bacterium]MBW2534806.1 poly-gamma-glutamate synthase PgsB [Deltaproteobacteria bacterium]
MTTGIELLAAATASLVALGAAEMWSHRRRLRTIETRIHVAGTRGKSSVTRLVAAGLRHAGIPTAAKTTGTLARMILPDGREVPVFRPAGANITEQIRITHAALQFGAKALVLECMALQPALHWVSERKLVRATHGVITNARPDHLDVMGPTDADVAAALAGMVPVGGVLVTAEQKHLAVLERAARDRRTRLLAVTAEDVARVTEAELAPFSYLEHADNVAVALALLAELGIDREVALEGMWSARPDPGALTEYEIDFFGRRVVFVNAFAANDPQSTEMVWTMARERHPKAERLVAVFNLRGDRPSRTEQLAREATFWHAADRVVLMGGGAYLFAREASRIGVDADRFVYADSDRLEEIFEGIMELCGPSTLVIGMANIGGQGLGLVRLFRNRRTLGLEAPPLSRAALSNGA